MSAGYAIAMQGLWIGHFGCRAAFQVTRRIGGKWNQEIDLNEFGAGFVERIRGYEPNHTIVAIHMTLHLNGLKLVYSVDYRLLEGGILYLSRVPSSSVFGLDLHWVEP